ncbi:MAG: glycosyltransferase family 2 protein [Nanoarchaeota archaeon]|nr:glycosyltransferase family 2 protein [Nanoarchaeota archaeon]
MKLSIILPTYNNEKTIEECLNSIFSQKFPKQDFEVLFLDGGSTDNTLKIAKTFPVKIINNPKRNEEAARILGIKKSKGEILAFIDADNILVGNDWFKKMLQPFKEKDIAFADTLYYSFRKSDKLGVRYQALIGGDDPIVSYLGFYSRWNYHKNNWTDFPYENQDKGDYLKISLSNKEKVPAMGSNGFLVRTSIAKKFIKDTFIHSDFVYDLINNNHNCFAKVKTGIIHNQPKFFSNKIRRMQRRQTKEIKIKYNYNIKKSKTLLTAIYILLIIPLIIDTIVGYIRKKDSAWLFHTPATLILFFMYLYYSVR